MSYIFIYFRSLFAIKKSIKWLTKQPVQALEASNQKRRAEKGSAPGLLWNWSKEGPAQVLRHWGTGVLLSDTFVKYALIKGLVDNEVGEEQLSQSPDLNLDQSLAFLVRFILQDIIRIRSPEEMVETFLETSPRLERFVKTARRMLEVLFRQMQVGYYALCSNQHTTHPTKHKHFSPS